MIERFAKVLVYACEIEISRILDVKKFIEPYFYIN